MTATLPYWVLWCVMVSSILPIAVDSNQEDVVNKSSPFYDEFKCKKGLFVPKWEPSENIALGDRIARAIVYFLSLCYLFLGVSIIAERFMSSIEVITAKEKEVKITKNTGEKTTLRVKIWNETVSNLTLMALGSSAPEIMLTAIEIVGNDFQAGELGPGTIVGSAAFNLFVIIGLCISIIPTGEVRRIKHLRVFFVTATWSIVAYLWLYLIVATISPGVIKIWEGVVTLLLFPLTVGTAYIADTYLIKSNKRAKLYRPSRHHNVVIEMEGESDVEEFSQRPTAATHGYSRNEGKLEVPIAEGQAVTEELVLFEDHRNQYIDILRELRHKHPAMKMKSLESLAETEVMSRGPKSRAYYRIQATKKLTGGAVYRHRSDKETKPENDTQVNKLVTSVVFEPAHYTVMENIGTFKVFVKRKGGNLRNTVFVDYYTEDGTANAGSDYEHTQGTLIFEPGEVEKVIHLTIIDDDIYEEDEHFYIKLGGLKYSKDDTGRKYDGGADTDVILGTPAVATIMILDDDHPGVFHFENDVHNVSEAVGECHVKVTRSSGARGIVKLPYRTVDGTAKAGVDYTEIKGELTFLNNEYQKHIKVPIADRENYERSGSFHIEILEPSLIVTPRSSQILETIKLLHDPNDMTEEERVAEMGKPRLGDIKKIEINITESEDFKKTVDKLLDRMRPTFLMEPSTWADQFKQAVTVTSGDDGEEKAEAGGEDTNPTFGDYVMHYMSLFWKLVFATVPPTDYGGGWWCFVLSIVWIGILTGIINDLASAFGCTIKLKDSVTAVTFVALGTSVPDTFASKVAAIGDKYADSSIGNVTGSNAVNVFLGIGVAWTMAAIVNAFRGQPFEVRPGNLAFSLTIFCTFALSAIALILFRRSRFIGGELGGPYIPKIISSLFLVTLWVMYITLSSLEAYDVISGF